MLLKQAWQDLCGCYGTSQVNIERCWQELSDLYSASGRYYHTLGHVQSLLNLAQEFKSQFEQPDMIGWAIWYHDAVYNPTATDNEAQSAALAEKRLVQLNVPLDQIRQVITCIQATAHLSTFTSNHPDLDLFLDLDLAILGSESKQYQHYTQAVRREYQMFSEREYQTGRSQVLSHFLALPWIYRTAVGRERWEAQAQQNLRAEFVILKQEV